MKRLIVYILPLVAFILSGCVTRVVPYEVDRVDQELKGNRGIVTGKVEDLPETKEKKTRRMYSIEIELPSRTDRDSKRKDSAARGNRGYIMGTKALEKKPVSTLKKKKGSTILQPQRGYAVPQVVFQRPLGAGTGTKYKKEEGAGELVKGKTTPKTYVVQKGDTLQKISDKVYGTTKVWKKIFDANKDVLGDSNKIKPGQELVIPELD